MFDAKPLQWIRMQNHRSREILSDDPVKHFTTEDVLPPPPYSLPPTTCDIVPNDRNREKFPGTAW